MSPTHRVLPLRLLSRAALLSAVLTAAAEPLAYNRDIRPILSDNCFNCHGPDSASRKAGLRLDKFEEATRPNKDGVAAIVPGDTAKSSLVARLVTTDEDDLMPPPESHKELKPEQIAALTRWVSEGAKYEAHWSFIPPSRPPVPAVADPAWSKHPVDAFLFTEMEKAGLAPNPGSRPPHAGTPGQS